MELIHFHIMLIPHLVVLAIDMLLMELVPILNLDHHLLSCYLAETQKSEDCYPGEAPHDDTDPLHHPWLDIGVVQLYKCH